MGRHHERLMLRHTINIGLLVLGYAFTLVLVALTLSGCATIMEGADNAHDDWRWQERHERLDRDSTAMDRWWVFRCAHAGCWVRV